MKDIFVVLGIIAIAIVAIIVGTKHGMDIDSIVTHSFTALGSITTGYAIGKIGK